MNLRFSLLVEETKFKTVKNYLFKKYGIKTDTAMLRFLILQKYEQITGLK